MIQRVLSHYNQPEMMCFGLVIFMTVFAGALLWVFRKSSSDFYSGLEQLPLQDLKPNLNGDH